MERFELTIVAQGAHSIWIALLIVALLCMTALAMLLFFCTRYRPLPRAPFDFEHRRIRRPDVARRRSLVISDS
jgi:hypothetical protein